MFTRTAPCLGPGLVLGLFLLAVSAVRADVSDLVPTLVSGGSGAVTDIQADDGVFYSAAKGNMISIRGFDSVGGDVSSAVLHVKFTVQSGYSGTHPIRVNGVDTGIVPTNGDTQRSASVEIAAGNFRINTWPEITALAVTFSNNDTGQGQSVQFDHAHLVVTHTAYSHAPPTWSDEFDDSGPPNPSFWTFEQGFVRNEELQWYQTNNAWQEGGDLIIESRREQVLNPDYNPASSDWRVNRQYADYTSASIISAGKVSFQYGRMQVRAKIPCYPGSWPAIWTLGNTGEWPSNGECDIMEYYQVDSILANCARGTTTRWTAAWDAVKKPVSNFTPANPDWRNGYHVWTMQWDDQNVRLYVDNHLMNTTPQSWLVNPVTTWGPAEPFKQPHYILLNLAIGSNGGNPANTAFPLRYQVDYVRVWEGLTNNNTPADIALSADSINAGLPAGTVVGTLSATDADAAEIHAFSLVSGTGSTHNASFEIVSSSGETQTAVLRSKQVLSASDGATRVIRIRVTDIEGATHDEVMTLNVLSTGQLVHHFEISPVASPQTVGTAVTGITITALDASNNIATGFTGSVTFGGTGGFSGTSADFTAGVLDGVSVIPTVAGGNLTLTVHDGAGHAGSVVIATIQSIYAAWSGGSFANPFTGTAPGDNPDGDILINLLEFAFGMDPTSGVLNPVAFDPGGDVTAPGLPVLMNFATGGEPDDLRAVFARRKDHPSTGLSYTVEFSADLGRWTAVATGLRVLTGETGSVPLEAASVPFPALVPVAAGGPDQAPKFFRVAVSLAPP